MSKKAFISRYLLILKKLKESPYSSLKEIERYLNREFSILNEREGNIQLSFSPRTLLRDISEIRNLFGIEISYSRLENGYFIEGTDFDNMNFQRMMEAFHVYNSLNMAKDLEPFIIPEKRQARGEVNLNDILHAIKFSKRIGFSYHKFTDEKPTPRSVDPLALKEFKQRWYLIAYESKVHSIKSFALDRMYSLVVKTEHFTRNPDLNVEEIYQHCFGIISPNDDKPYTITLSFEPLQGKYVKTLPLHPSQKILKDDQDELRISLNLYITHDFIMELLSYGDQVRVLKPASLSKTIKNAHAMAAALYNT